MDTDLIDECVKTIDLIEGNEEHIPDEKIKAMRQNVDQKYKDWQSVLALLVMLGVGGSATAFAVQAATETDRSKGQTSLSAIQFHCVHD